MNQKMSVMIVDDHALFRAGLKSIIQQDLRYDIIGEAGSYREGIQKAIELRPDLMVVDISLPDRDGICLTSEVKRNLPNTAIIIVSIHSKGEFVARALQSGAKGYITKESTPKELLHGLEVVSSGEYYIDSALSSEVAKKLSEKENSEDKFANSLYASLTSREQEILRQLVEDNTVGMIAKNLFISVKTVENHRTSIMKKLNLRSSIDMVRYSAKIGLIDIDEWKG